jgi:hypothetical protein
MSLAPPHEDYLSGACVRLPEATVLLTGDEWRAAEAALHAQGEPLLSGGLALRYALPFQYEDDALIPQLVFDDHRREHTGQALFTFVYARGYAYPRADVIGVRLSGGQEEARLKDFDLALPLVPVVYSREEPEAGPARVDVGVIVDASEEEWRVIEADGPKTALPALFVAHRPSFRLNAALAPGLTTLLKAWLASRA